MDSLIITCPFGAEGSDQTERDETVVVMGENVVRTGLCSGTTLFDIGSISSKLHKRQIRGSDAFLQISERPVIVA